LVGGLTDMLWILQLKLLCCHLVVVKRVSPRRWPL